VELHQGTTQPPSGVTLDIDIERELDRLACSQQHYQHSLEPRLDDEDIQRLRRDSARCAQTSSSLTAVFFESKSSLGIVNLKPLRPGRTFLHLPS